MRIQRALLVILFGLVAAALAEDDPLSIALKYKSFSTSGISMEPTIASGDVVYVDTSYYSTNRPRVGDVVIYQSKSRDVVVGMKRIAALGGSKVQIRDAKLIVDGRVIDEPYLMQDGAVTPYSRSWGPVDLPAGCIFLLGDYRDHSQDSRAESCYFFSDLVGLVRYVAPSGKALLIHAVK